MGAYKPRIAAIGTGGSISSVARHSLDLFEYGDYGHILAIDKLVDAVPEVAANFDVVPIPFRTVSSEAIGPEDWLDLNEVIHRAAADHDVEGIVIIHGTATLEETAYFLNLTVKINMPVVLVGAQRPINGLSTDGPLNLMNAFRVAGSREARGLGVLTVLNDEIQAAREVTKTSTFRLQTFRTPDFGVLGYADSDGRIAIYRRPVRRCAPDTEFDLRGVRKLPDVDIAFAYAGAKRHTIDALVAAGAKAIVIAAFAPGLPAFDQRAGLKDARQVGVHVIVCSHAGSGRVIDRKFFRENGFLTADNLNPKKARILAMIGLKVTEDPKTLQRFYEEY